jgi:hypothetical protein
VAALGDVALRAAEAADQEVAQALLGAGEIVRRIHRTEQVVAADPAIEGGDQAGEALLADAAVDLVLGGHGGG